jgi:hypothetical protein
MQAIGTDHQIEAAPCGVLEGDVDAIGILLQRGYRVTEQDLGPVLARVQQDRGQVGTRKLDLPAARGALQREPVDPTRRPALLTKLIPVTFVASARMRSMTPIRSATSTAGPRTSIGLPLERWPAARSTTVGRKPCSANQ